MSLHYHTYRIIYYALPCHFDRRLTRAEVEKSLCIRKDLSTSHLRAFLRWDDKCLESYLQIYVNLILACCNCNSLMLYYVPVRNCSENKSMYNRRSPGSCSCRGFFYPDFLVLIDCYRFPSIHRQMMCVITPARTAVSRVAKNSMHNTSPLSPI